MYNSFYEAPYEDSEESSKFERQLMKIEYIEEEETWNTVPVASAVRNNLHVFLSPVDYALKVQSMRDVATGRGVIHVTILHGNKHRKMAMNYNQVKGFLQGKDQNPAKKFFATVASMIIKAFMNNEQLVIVNEPVPEPIIETVPVVTEIVQKRVDEMVKKMTETPIEVPKHKRKYTKRDK